MTFHELVIGDVLIAPFMSYAAGALVLMLLVRPLLVRAGFEQAFGAPPVAMLSLYVVILTLLIVLV